jgi:hypothetical protein
VVVHKMKKIEGLGVFFGFQGTLFFSCLYGEMGLRKKNCTRWTLSHFKLYGEKGKKTAMTKKKKYTN